MFGMTRSVRSKGLYFDVPLILHIVHLNSINSQVKKLFEPFQKVNENLQMLAKQKQAVRIKPELLEGYPLMGQTVHTPQEGEPIKGD